MSRATVRHEQGKMRQEITVGEHRLVSDVSVAEGGEAAGPSPHDYLAAALGACTALTLRLYARHKKWPLENAEVVVDLTHEAGLAKFERRLRLDGPLDAAQRERLLKVAESCPVHKALTGRIEIVTQLAAPRE
jgi:putative redox protein